MSDYLINLIEKDNSIISIEHEETDQTGTSAQTDYRFVGANPNNYVCLETDGTCDEDNLYRIIGVIPTQKDEEGDYENRVKLVKNTSIGQYTWSGNSNISNIDWTQSTLNKEILNETYWSEIEDYQKYIELAKWYLGITGDSSKSLTYKQERQNNTDSPNNFIANIGLMYVSDFAYSLDPQYNSLCIYPNHSWHDNVDCQNNAWIASNKTQWLINPNDATKSFVVLANVWATGKHAALAVKPSFYLKSQVKYLGGTGETSNPYRIMID